MFRKRLAKNRKLGIRWWKWDLEAVDLCGKGEACQG
jgi:hypothetical protein